MYLSMARKSLASFPTYVEVPGPCDPEDLIDGTIFAANFLGSTQLLSDKTPSKNVRIMQAQEAVSRIKASEGESQPVTEVDLFISTQRIKVLNADTKETMMDHLLKTISYIVDIGNIVVLMARRQMSRSNSQDNVEVSHPSQEGKRQYKMICYVFESEDICSVMRGGIGEQGGVQVGHRIIEINGQSAVATPHEKIVHVLSNAVGEISTKNSKSSYLVAAPDLRQFLENSELPRAVNTHTLSGAGILRMVNKAADAVNKMTIKMNESDAWFEEKQQQFENLDQQLRKLHASVKALLCHRKELSANTAAFAKSAAMLGNSEDHTALSRALSQLAEIEEKIDQLHQEQVFADFYVFSELLGDYIRLIAAVKWETKVQQGGKDFEHISKTIREEVQRFERERVKDFKAVIIKYLKSLVQTQQQLIKYWEAFLSEAKSIA